MNMRRLMKMGAKALKLQYKRMPEKRFMDDSGEEVSFKQLAEQIEVINSVMYRPESEFYVQQKGKDCWVVTRKQVNSNVRHNRH